MSGVRGVGSVRAVVLDAYGTLLDVHGAMRGLSASLPPDWERISAEWRAKQLEYTWVRSLTGPAHHRDFWQVTADALGFVAARHRITDAAVLATLLDAYRRLPAYPDAAPALERLRGRGLRIAVLSNATPAMLEEALDAAGLSPLLEAVLSVESVGVFKPDPRVYAHALERLGLEAAAVAFVSGNAWDAQAAVAAGLPTFWCNRAGLPDEYGLREAAAELQGLAALPDMLA